MPHPFVAGDVDTFAIKERYVEGGKGYGLSDAQIVYAPGTDVMRSGYEYYTFDKAAFEEACSAGDNKVKFRVLSVADSVKQLGDPNLPQPEGGFRNTYYQCEVV